MQILYANYLLLSPNNSRSIWCRNIHWAFFWISLYVCVLIRAHCACWHTHIVHFNICNGQRCACSRMCPSLLACALNWTVCVCVCMWWMEPRLFVWRRLWIQACWKQEQIGTYCGSADQVLPSEWTERAGHHSSTGDTLTTWWVILRLRRCVHCGQLSKYNRYHWSRTLSCCDYECCCLNCSVSSLSFLSSVSIQLKSKFSISFARILAKTGMLT